MRRSYVEIERSCCGTPWAMRRTVHWLYRAEPEIIQFHSTLGGTSRNTSRAGEQSLRTDWRGVS
jgi:hypothetical protein